MTDDYMYYLEILRTGAEADLNELAELDATFPTGVDQYLGRSWIINAIDCGSLESVRWMLTKTVELNFRDEEGSTVLSSAIDRDADDKYTVLEMLLAAGADVNQKGTNDWTPAHLAAARNDVDALKILVQYGADLSIRTEIDEYATPLEEARILDAYGDCQDAIRYLGTVGSSFDP